MLERKYDNKYYIITCCFPDWNNLITTCTKIPCIHPNYVPDAPNHYIIPLDLRDRQIYGLFNISEKRMIFNMDINNVIILENKCLFAKFMIENYPMNIPRTISILTNNIDYFDTFKPIKMIKKGAIGCAGNSVTVIHELDKSKRENNFVVSEYINHTESYTGHFLIHKGVVLKHIIFRGNNPEINDYIKRGPFKNYDVIDLDQLIETGIDVSIFENIFKQLNYSGFACPEFVVVDNVIKIFEINPRPGGSLIANKQYCKEFFNTIIETAIID